MAAVDVEQYAGDDAAQTVGPDEEEQAQYARPEQFGRVYAATAAEAVQDPSVITGTLPISSVPAIVLFDSGSTHTFLARAFVDRVGVRVEDLGHDLVVSTPAGATLTTGLCVRGVPVVIQRHRLLTDFVVLPMGEFDAIFGMDWMTRHRALIDCQKKKVQLRPSPQERVTFQGRGRSDRDGLVSFHRARQLVERGCEAFLARIVDIRQQPAQAAESSTVGQTELAVEMCTDDQAIAEESRQIPPFGSEELRSQLQTMRDQGLIPPSASPDDAPIILIRKEDGGIRVCIDYSF